VVAIQKAAASRGDFYREAALAVVRLVGLDLGMVLFRSGGDWRVAARESRDARTDEGVQPDRDRTGLPDRRDLLSLGQLRRRRG
jgi:hypothetical protein